MRGFRGWGEEVLEELFNTGLKLRGTDRRRSFD